MTVWHLQHDHAGDDMLEVPLGWTFSAVVNDCDMNSKIRARHDTRNRLSIPRYYLTEGRRALSFYAKVFHQYLPHDNRLPPVELRGGARGCEGVRGGARGCLPPHNPC